MNRQIIQLYKQAYKESFEKIHKQEIYKWKAVQVFQENWDINADDFAGMLEKSLSKTGNLLDSNNTFPRKMAVSNSEKSPFEMRELFKRLFNEEDDVLERMKSFREDFKLLNNRNFPDKTDYQNHREILVYLCLKYPENYYFYKFNMFKDFAGKVEYDYIPRMGRYENLSQYYHLCELVKQELISDQELLKLHKNRIEPDCFFDSSLNILTQDFIYAVVRHLNVTKPDVLKQKPAKVDTTTSMTSSVSLKKKDVDFTARIINHQIKNAENKRLGDLGELWVVEQERLRLINSGRSDLSLKVEHIAMSKGDGAGYDILSFDEQGNELLIEVKTTKGGLKSNFYITRNELERSMIEESKYRLYRVYDFDIEKQMGKIHIFKGSLTSLCQVPTQYQVYIDKL
jgi:hypothetical protein